MGNDRKELVLGGIELPELFLLVFQLSDVPDDGSETGTLGSFNFKSYFLYLNSMSLPGLCIDDMRLIE